MVNSSLRRSASVLDTRNAMRFAAFVKMAAAVAIWVGLDGMIRYALAVAAAGGVVALVMYFLSRKAIRQEVRTNLTLAALQQSLPSVEVRAGGRPSVPYGLAIAAGAAFALLT